MEKTNKKNLLISFSGGNQWIYGSMVIKKQEPGV